jgi:integrase
MTTTWNLALREWVAEQRAAGLSEATIRLWHGWLKRLAKDHPDPWGVTRSDLVHWLAMPSWAPETRRSARAALRSFYRWGKRRRLIRSDPAKRLASIRIPRAKPRPAPDEVIVEAMARASLRVRLMLMLAAFCGLRRGEIAKVHSDDLTGRLLRVKGKGGVQRDVPVPLSLAALMRAQSSGWLFPSGSASGHLTPGYVGKLMSRALPGRWTAHTLRHAAATAWSDEGLDLHELAELLGHASVTTTRIYTMIRPLRLADGVDRAAKRLDTIPPPAAGPPAA